MRYWKPGTNIVKYIYIKYKRDIKNGDYLVISDKAVSIAKGSIYDENIIKTNVSYKIAAFLISRVFWGKICTSPFSTDIINILRNTPLELLAKHKKLSLYIGGIKHLIKPVSEAGIDTTNLPYTYVSIPMKSIQHIANEIKQKLDIKLKVTINILIIDSDKSYRPRFLNNIAFSTRPSYIKGIIDLGGIAYFMGKKYRKYFVEYPTPVAYSGRWPGLNKLLTISQIAERAMGHGIGRNILEMMRKLKIKNFEELGWRHMLSTKHYPVILIKEIVNF